MNILVTGVVMLAVDAAGADVAELIDVVFKITQLLIALAGLVGAVALVTWLLEPPKPTRVIRSSSARYAAAAGGVKATEMQA